MGNNQNSKENPRQSTEKVIDKTQKKTVEKTNGTSVEETQSAKEKTGRARNAEQTFERSPQKKTESVENTKSSENASTTGRKNPSGNIIPADSRIPSKYGSSVDSGNASKYAASTGSADTSTNAERDRQARQEELKRLTQVQRLVNQPGRKTREELVSLLDDIKKRKHQSGYCQTVHEQVGNRIRAMDEKKIKEICGDVGRMDFGGCQRSSKTVRGWRFPSSVEI